MKVSSYTAGGISNRMLGAMNVSVSSTASVKKVTQRSKNMQKKALNYNPREISSALIRASKARSAGQVLTQAKSRLNALAKAKGSGQYNDSEVNAAIAHAKRMVRCANMKTQNLRQEERMEKRYMEQARSEERQEKNQAKVRAVQKERNLEQKQEIAEIQFKQKQKKMSRDLLQKKKTNRNREQNKISEADMDYLKQKMRELGQPSSGNTCPIDGVMLDLSQNGVQLSDAQLEQLAGTMTGEGATGGTTGGSQTAGTEMAALNVLI